MQSSNTSPPDVKLKSVKEDDEDVLFDEQSIRSLSRQCSTSSDCTLETTASAEFEEQTHLSRPPNNDNITFSSVDNDVNGVSTLDLSFKDKSCTNVKRTDL